MVLGPILVLFHHHYSRLSWPDPSCAHASNRGSNPRGITTCPFPTKSFGVFWTSTQVSTCRFRPLMKKDRHSKDLGMFLRIFCTRPTNLRDVIFAALAAPYPPANSFALHRIALPRNHAALRHHSMCFQLVILIQPQMPLVLELIVL